MAFFTRNFEDIVSSSLQALSAQTNITQLSPGSKARFILDTVNREQAAQFQIFDVSLVQAFIKYADGKFLDMFGDLLQIPRINSTHAEDSSNNFMFYVQTGTFGDINQGNDFSIPANQQISTVPLDTNTVTPGIVEQPIIRYKLVDSITLRANQSVAYVAVRAETEGLGSSIARNVLNRHSFSSYASSAQNKLKCTNTFAIQNGTNRESDASYRFRLLGAFRAKSLANRSAIRLAALSVAGVSDVIDVLAEQGPGSVSVYVQGLTPTTGPRLLEEVAVAVGEVASWGVRVFVFAPTPLGIQLGVKVNWSPRATQIQVAEGYTIMRQAVENYMNGLDIGDELIFETLINVMLSEVPLALSIGGVRPNKFEEIYVHRENPSKASATVKSLVYGEVVTTLYNEKIILETSGRHRGIKFK